MSDAAEREGSHETPVQPPDEPQEPQAPEPMADEEDLSEAEGLPDVEQITPPASRDEEPPAPPAQAEPGIYRCIGEVAGEHAILGLLTPDQEYDYRRVSDPRVLQAVAAYVEIGILGLKEASPESSPEDETPSDESSHH